MKSGIAGLKINKVMETQPFFTEEEKREFFSKYRVLLRHLYGRLEEDDLPKIKQCMNQVVAHE